MMSAEAVRPLPVAFRRLERVTVTVSSGSTVLSPTTCTEIVAVV